MVGKSCHICSANITDNRFPGVECAGCQRMFHAKCVKLSNDMFDGIKEGLIVWNCTSCRPRTRRSKVVYKDDVPTNSPTISPEMESAELMEILKDLRQRLESMEKSLQFISSFHDDLKNELRTINKDNKSIKDKLYTLDNITTEHDKRINNLEIVADLFNQEKLKNNIIIAGLPSNLVNKFSAVEQIANKLNVEITNNDIEQNIIELKQKNKQDTSTYVVQCKSQQTKLNLLMKSRKIRICTDDLKLSNGLNNRIFVMHHLTALQSKLYYEAKKTKNKYNFKYLWISNGKIMLRKEEGSKFFPIISLHDIKHIHSIMENEGHQDDELTSHT